MGEIVTYQQDLTRTIRNIGYTGTSGSNGEVLDFYFPGNEQNGYKLRDVVSMCYMGTVSEMGGIGSNTGLDAGGSIVGSEDASTPPSTTASKSVAVLVTLNSGATPATTMKFKLGTESTSPDKSAIEIVPGACKWWRRASTSESINYTTTITANTISSILLVKQNNTLAFIYERNKGGVFTLPTAGTGIFSWNNGFTYPCDVIIKGNFYGAAMLTLSGTTFAPVGDIVSWADDLVDHWEVGKPYITMP